VLTATRLQDSDVVRVDYDDGLDEAAVRAALPVIEGVVAEHGHVRLLVHVGRLGRVGIHGLRDDLGRFGDVGRIDRVALLADAVWLRLAAKAQAKALGIELQAYRGSEGDEALAWIRA
jgi:hypothetical protein